MTVHIASGGALRPGNSRREAGMVTAEYAVGTLGACGIACVLISTAPELVDYLSTIIEVAFSPIITGLLS